MDEGNVQKVSGASPRAWACPASHTSPAFHYVAALSAPETARAVELTTLVKGPRPKFHPPLRGAVKVFSPASRRRLLWKIGQIDEAILASSLFLTLTYPAADPTQEQRQSHLDALLKRLRRKAPTASAIWKLEYTKLNTPHYHLIILNLHYWAHAEIAKAWSEIVRSENHNHEKAGTRIERTASKRQLSRYIVKYVSKSGPLPPNHQGRIWGTAGPLHLAFSPKRIYLLTRDAWRKIRRTLDQIRISHKRASPFRRQSNEGNSQRWYLSGAEVIRYLSWFGVSPIPEPGRT
jgi:hypothetical protein